MVLLYLIPLMQNKTGKCFFSHRVTNIWNTLLKTTTVQISRGRTNRQTGKTLRSYGFPVHPKEITELVVDR